MRSKAFLLLALCGAAAALARVAVGFGFADFALLHVALVGWIVAFAGFVIVYRPILTAPR